MPLTTKNDTAFHEAGHALISYLASDIIVVQFVTANISLSRIQETNATGGVKGRLTKDPKKLTFCDHDILFLMSLAGKVADDINHLGGTPNKNLLSNSNFAESMSDRRYLGDIGIMQRHLPIIMTLIRVKQTQYMASCQELLYEIFFTDWIITIMMELRNKIAEAPEQTLSGQQLLNYLDQTRLKTWKDKEWQKIKTERASKFELGRFRKLIRKTFNF